MRLKISWEEPLNFAKKIAANYGDQDWCFLYSGLNEEVKNSISYIAIFPQKKIVSDDFFAAEKILKNSEEKWFGYFAYETAWQFEKLPKVKKSFIDLPKIFLINFALIFEFNHAKKTLTAVFKEKELLDKALRFKDKKTYHLPLTTCHFFSNFSNPSYLSSISSIRKMIARGDLYQSNLTRKFFGKFTKNLSTQENFNLFCELATSSKANYSSFLKFGESAIISSSPELFFSLKNKKIISRPIKGTAARGANLSEDKKNKSQLKNSPKERAENLMIVDLVRNDLSRICKAGSVVVKKLFAINSYKNLHHMSSEIHGEIAENFSAIDALRSLFAPGSMTGAPKIKAMEIAAKKEKIARGIYSGCIGFLSKDSANFSVVIRTLIVKKNKFEFQTGGAITFDSNPKSELEEVFCKAEGISKLLKINLKKSI